MFQWYSKKNERQWVQTEILEIPVKHRKCIFTLGVVKCWNRLPEKFWSFCPWRFSGPNWRQPWATWSWQSFFNRGSWTTWFPEVPSSFKYFEILCYTVLWICSHKWGTHSADKHKLFDLQNPLYSPCCTPITSALIANSLFRGKKNVMNRRVTFFVPTNSPLQKRSSVWAERRHDIPFGDFFHSHFKESKGRRWYSSYTLFLICCK